GNHPHSQERYEALVFGEGDFKGVFKAIKGATSGRGLDRVFIAGVSPVVLHDVSSGFNIAENIYLGEDLNDLCGFTEAEVTTLLTAVANECKFTAAQINEARTMMRTYYDGSRFSDEGGEHIYNPTSTFYFLKYLQRTCRYPRKMLDSNLAPDHSKLAYVASLAQGEATILNIVNDGTPLAVVELEDRFGVEQMLASSNTEAFMLSLLYYLGGLTLADTLSPDGKLILRIPNLVMERLYAHRLREMLLPDAGVRDEGQIAAEALYSQGRMEPLVDFIERRIFPIFDNRDYLQANELMVKTAFLMLLFNDTFYMIDSETPLNHGYADLTMLLRPEMRQYELLDILLEFKLVKLNALNLDARAVRTKTREELLALALVQAEIANAQKQGQEYSATLTAKHGASLKLRAFAVVAIGFEKWVWQPVPF
ncbi:MAG: AAA family ATPase, partial [Caldilineaceae bacterium]